MFHLAFAPPAAAADQVKGQQKQRGHIGQQKHGKQGGEQSGHALAQIGHIEAKDQGGGILEMFVDWRNLPAMTDAVQMAGWVWRGVVVWDKGISRNQPGRFRNDCEFVVWCSNGDLPIDWKAAKGTKAMPGVYHVPIVAPKQRFHQTEKPVELLESLLAICTPGGTVLDAFMGSGSTGVAAVKTGRSFIGMELSDQYFDTATKRIQEAEDELLNDF